MSSEIKKMGVVLGGALGIALITVGTTLAIQKIQHPVTPPPEPPVPVAPVVPPIPLAQVISVKPHYVNISVPHKRCHQVPHTFYQQTQSRHPGIGAAVGGVAGALVGQTVGSGDTRLAASAAGAAIGALSGNALQKNMHHPQAYTEYTTICSSYSTTKKEQKGFEVTYQYNGMQGMAIMSMPPTTNTLTLPIQESEIK